MMKTTEQREQQEEIQFWSEMEEPLNSPEVIVTYHAGERLQSRVAGKKQSVSRIAQKALEHGITEQDASGQLKKYILKKKLKKGMAEHINIRVFHQHVYIFANNNNILITVFRLPNRLLKLEEKVKQRQMQSAS